MQRIKMYRAIAMVLGYICASGNGTLAVRRARCAP